MQQQTGNVIENHRSHATDPILRLPLKSDSFWPMLDAIGKQNGIGFSPYQHDGGVALVDAPYRALKTSYHGPFRFAFKRIAVSLDEETQARSCTVALDVAWEPRFQPLYLNLEEAVVRVRDSKKILERQSPRSVSGTSATELDLLWPAPPRTAERIDSLQGAIRVIGAPKMLEFALKLSDAPTAAMQEGVKLSITQTKTLGVAWTVDVLIETSTDPKKLLESYQSWMDNNRLWLAWRDPKSKVIHKLEPIGEAPLNVKQGTKIRYVFQARDKTPLPPSASVVTLHYRTPNRIEAFMVPFAFQDLPLP